MIAVTITGLVLGMSENTVPETFFVLFAIAAIVCTGVGVATSSQRRSHGRRQKRRE